MKRFPQFLTVSLIVAALWLASCGGPEGPTPTPSPPPATPTPTPTPLPAILRQEFTTYEDPGGAFTLQAPTEWSADAVGGGVRFQDPGQSATQFAVYHQQVPGSVDGGAYLASVISATLTAPQAIQPDSYQLVGDETDSGGRRRIEWVGQTGDGGTPVRFLGEYWLEGDAVAGISLMGLPTTWEEVLPLWSFMQENFAMSSGAEGTAGEVIVHPSQTLTLTVPIGWDAAPAEDGALLLQDASGLAQFAVAAIELDRAPLPSDLDDVLANTVGELAKEDGFKELANEQVSLHERLLRFDALSPEEGEYRTELRAFTGGNTIYLSSFSTPRGDAELFRPTYDFLRGSMALAHPPLDEALQDADSLLGIEVGNAMLAIPSNNAAWVSAPIFNGRTRGLGDLTAAVELYDGDNVLLGAESWRLEQRTVPAGGTTYLTKRIGGDVASVGNARYAVVRLVTASDTKDSALASWEYVTGKTETNAAGNVVLKATLRNPSKDVRRYIYLVGLVYDKDGKLVFARADTQRLPYAVPKDAEVDVKVVMPGAFSDLASFNVVGEVP